MFFRENAVLVEYRKKVVEAKLVAVVEQDRAALQNYLEGKIDSCPQIDLSVLATTNGSLQEIHPDHDKSQVRTDIKGFQKHSSALPSTRFVVTAILNIIDHVRLLFLTVHATICCSGW